MPVYRPRMLARIFVPNVGTPSQRTQQEELDDVTQLQVRIHRARISYNNHSEADECEISCSYDDAGLDPRILRSAEIYVYLGDGDANGNFTATADNQRFVGIATDVTRDFDDSGGKNITIKALDYTTLFLEAKQFPPTGVPDFSQTLTEAWARICDNTGYYDISTRTLVSTVQRLRERIVFEPPDLASLTIGKAVSPRIAKLGKIQVKNHADAWSVWQTAVGSLGLISFIRGDRCVVTTATDYYTGDDPPRFIYGKNIKHIKETRDTHSLSGKNVGIMSFNPLTMQTIEAFWPPLGFVKAKGGGKKKKLGASALGAPFVVRAEDYEIFDCPLPISDPVILERFAQLVWEIRSRQELKGELTTAEMFVDTLAGDRFDLLQLQGGDRVRVELEPDALTWIQRLKSVGARIAALQGRGYSPDMASYLARNLDGINDLTPEFQVHRVETSLDVSDPDGGSYEQTIEFVNRIDVSGSAKPGTGTGTPPITNQQSTAKNGTAEKQRDAVDDKDEGP